MACGITSKPAQKFRFLTIIQVNDNQVQVIKRLALTDGLSHLTVGDWDIKVQLDGSKEAMLQVADTQLKSVFSYGNLPVSFSGKTYQPQMKNSSILLENNGTKINKTEVVDELPDVAKFDAKR